MKKMICFVSFMLLAGCSTHTENETPVETIKEKGDAKFINMYEGADATDGFYHLVLRDTEDGFPITNILYYDYQSKKEIYVCDKPECKHTDTSCSSFVEGSALANQVFVDGEHLYLIQNEGAIVSFGDSGQKVSSSIQQMDLDGKNKKLLYTLDEGYAFDTNNLVLADHIAYMQVIKTEYVAMNGGESGITTDKKLYGINLTSGKHHEVCDMKFKSLEGADESFLMIRTLSFQEDMDQLLKDQNYEAYSNAFLSATTSYQTFDINHSSWGESIPIEDVAAVYDKGYLYEIDATNQVLQTSIETLEKRVVTQLSNEANYSISFIRDGYMRIDAFEKEVNNAAFSFLDSYSLHIENSVLEKSTIYKKNQKSPVKFLAEYDGSYLMNYDHDGQVVDKWAGTQQFETEKEYIGFINKADFWSSNPTFQPITNAD